MGCLEFYLGAAGEGGGGSGCTMAKLCVAVVGLLTSQKGGHDA
jgi:hypothetical protein